MTKFVRVLALALAIFCCTWVAVLWWWQRSGRVTAEVDLVVYLVLLPLVLLVLAFALKGAWNRAAGIASAEPAMASEESAGGSTPHKGQPGGEQTRYATSLIVQVALLSTGGATASEVLQAAADGNPMPVPDKRLVNDAGLPVLCARLPDAELALEEVRDQLEMLAEQLRADTRWPVEQGSESVVRALAALQKPFMAQREWLLDLSTRAHDAQQRPHGVQLQRVRLLLGCAAYWSLFEQALAERWVEALWTSEDDAMAASYVLEILVLPGGGDDLLLSAHSGTHPSATPPEPAWQLLVAAHSDLDQQRIDSLSAIGRLYEASTAPGASMPGEAAAAVLIAPTDWVVPGDLQVQPVLLHQPASTQRAKPIEATGKVDSQALREAAAQAVSAARLVASQLDALVCDGDQHSQRATELYGLTIGDLPQLDPIEDMRVLGRVTGNVGAASGLLVVACASEWARATRKPVLALAMADSRQRLALIVTPLLPEDAVAPEIAQSTGTAKK